MYCVSQLFSPLPSIVFSHCITLLKTLGHEGKEWLTNCPRWIERDGETYKPQGLWRNNLGGGTKHWERRHVEIEYSSCLFVFQTLNEKWDNEKGAAFFKFLLSILNIKKLMTVHGPRLDILYFISFLCFSFILPLLFVHSLCSLELNNACKLSQAQCCVWI